MQVAVNAKSLLSALTIVRKMGKSPMPVRLMVTDDGVTVHFQNGDRRGSVNVSGTYFNVICGSIAIDVETACKSLRGVSGNVDCRSVETPIGTLSLIADADCSPRDKGRLRTDIMSPECEQSRKPSAIVEFEAHEFKRVFNLVAPCLDDDPRRYATGSILLDVDTKNRPETAAATYFVATDTRRLAFAEVSCHIVGELPNVQVFIDPQSVEAIGKALHGSVHVEVYDNGETVLRCRAAGVAIANSVAERFPRWRDVIPSLHDVAPVYRRELCKALDDCDTALDADGFHKTIVTLNGNCRVESHDKKTVKEVRWAEGCGVANEIEFYLDPTLINGALKAWTDPVIHFGTTRDDQSPVMFRSDLNKSRLIVMPMRKK